MILSKLMIKYLIPAVIIIFVIFLMLSKNNHNTKKLETNSFTESQRLAEIKLGELKPKNVTYHLVQEPRDIGSRSHLLEFIFSPDKIPYPADGVVRNFSIIIVVNQELQKVVSFKVGDNAEQIIE